MTTILLIEDDPIMGESLLQRFELEGLQVTWCRRLSEAREALDTLPSAVVSDVRLPDGLATEWFVALPATVRALPWFFLTGYGSVNDAVAAVRAGAREYLTKPFDIESLIFKIRTAANLSVAHDDEALLGVSVAMRRVEAILHKVAVQKVSVLLTGESGVGKEVAAQLIHSLDPKAVKGAFVAVNCAAIPETMLEAEFFGYEKGAFSGAVRTHKGYLERAHNGTLFLDEVGELPASMQAKLLRALQEKCFFRIGAERTTQSDFRILAATNRDLYADMNAGTFREDLFYRLAVIKIELPPLRERPEDIRWLTEKLLAQIVVEQGRPLAMSEPFLRDLMRREWRGNVRELRSFLEETVVLSDGGLLDLPDGHASSSQQAAEASEGGIVSLQRVVEKVERSHIQKALQHCDGSVGKTADVLGISRKTLWEKMKKLAIQS
ncbi:sigma-54 dependent transcriptional regulator [Limnohabitans sp. Bal53]|uniref:sigma-54-dependent transcriptional regulator n=1 Tax=Limnohabitans sp. Bal53 TaxID=1977910 RepID=UPI000D37B5D6|nr:sigma-54 dependent transcriptional regulator [Limnohabitans sp. Bal53]PUE39049.1 sigma-54-dependent Fis family transcriptional regulator [Limnohabitans sp. Bal53]